MDVKNLRGSILNDEMKYLHKHEPFHDDWYLSDVDALLVHKGKIIAVLDYKREAEQCTYTQKIVWKFFLTHEIPVFIVRRNQTSNYSIEKISIDINNKEYFLKIKNNIDIDSLAAWEGNLRLIAEFGF